MHKLWVVVSTLALAAPAFGEVTIELRIPKVTAGTYDPKVVSAAVEKARDKLLACYAAPFAKDPSLHGTVTATFTLTVEGKITGVTAKGVNPAVETCVARELGKLTLAKPGDGKAVNVTDWLVFGNDKPEATLGRSGTDGEYGTIGTGGFGPCGGGGGLGSWGPIGHGSGYGVGGCGGGGGMRARTAAVATVSIGQPTVTGDLDKAIIRRYVKRNIQKIQYCYEKAELLQPGLRGTVTAAFVIGPDGLVSSSSASGMQAKDAEKCIAEVIKAIEFPKPKSGQIVKVSYPLTFQSQRAKK